MNGREFWALRDVSDDVLQASLQGLLGAGARLEARVVAHLAEVEARRLHLRLGCSSLYDYCRKRLALSDYEAFVRIAAARVARQFPIVFGMLDRRELHLTAVCEVREFLTPDNHRDLLGEVSSKTKLQIREVLARRFPRADLPTSIKKLPALDPLSPGRYRLLLTLSATQKGKFERAGELLSHSNPSGDLAVVLERALDLLIERLEKRQFGALLSLPAISKLDSPEPPTNKPPRASKLDSPEPPANKPPRASQLQASNRQRSESTADSGASNQPAQQKPRKHLCQGLRRELLEREGASCTFTGTDGSRCGARAFLQFHHRQAWARGGADTADNLTLLCRAHNRLLAEQDFGRAHIEKVIASRGGEPRGEAGVAGRCAAAPASRYLG